MASNIIAKINSYEKLMRLDKPVGIFLLLWPTLWALWTASGDIPDFIILWVFVLGTVTMRSAGCVINDVADRHLDGHVQRTKDRPLVTGQVSVKEALVLFTMLSLSALMLLLILDVPLVIWLSIPALLTAASYPFAKRYIAIPQAHLGIAFSWGIPIAYAAVLGEVTETAWWLCVANLFWVIAYDTEYAMVDRKDDLKIGIKTSAIYFGRFDVAAVMCCYIAMLLTLGILCYYRVSWGDWKMYRWIFGALCIAGILVVYQYLLIRDRVPERCFRAFKHNNYIGLVIFIGFLLAFTVH